MSTHFRKSTLKCALVALIATFLVSCSQEKHTFPNQQWHDLNAHYNGYFLAKEKMKEAENNLELANKDNFNRLLNIYPITNKGSEASIAPMLLESIKKASLPIQRHKNSSWVDDCYIVIGKARYYKQEEYDLAVQTFKFINSKSMDPDKRHLALIWLMRTYIKGNEMANAKTALDYLRKQQLTQSNMREYLTVKAWYYQKEKDDKETAAALSRAVSLYWPGDMKSRIHYMLGQLNQKLGNDSISYAHYLRCIRLNPPYEMAFNAKLHIGAVTKIEDPKAIKKTQKYFKKLLIDPKNEEYKDKIYYEMARFEYKRSQLTESIELYNKSLRAETKTPSQKGYSYWRLAEIYYDKQKDFVKAKLYYDSTIIALDTAEETYKGILKRQKVLADFLKEYLVVQKEDSLQRYANMDSTEREKRLAILVARDASLAMSNAKAQKAAEKEAARIKKAQEALEGSGNTIFDNSQTGTKADGSGASTDGKWYFSSPAAMSSGRQDFIKKWGNRALSDDWRRISKEAPTNSSAQTNAPKDSSKANIAANSKNTKSEDKSESASDKSSAKPSLMESPSERRAYYMRDVPYTPEKLEKSNLALRVALYNLGKIYEQKLDESSNGEKCFNRVVTQHKQYEKVPECLYFLYSIYLNKLNRPEDAAKVKDRLLHEYPESLYAKLLQNPNYLQELKASNDKVKGRYQSAYQLYENEQFIEAQQTLASVKSEFAEHGYKDKIKILETLVIGRTLDYRIYKDSLNSFIKSNPKSELIPFAKDLIKVGDAYMAKLAASRKQTIDTNQKDTSKIKPIYKTPYNELINCPNQYIVLIPVGLADENTLRAKFDDFNKKYYTEFTFTVRTRLLNEQYMMLTVYELKSNIAALNYLKKQTDERSVIKDLLGNKKVFQFVITADNLRLLYGSKDILEYQKFFNDHYDISEL